jgi:hypothetical protein
MGRRCGLLCVGLAGVLMAAGCMPSRSDAQYRIDTVQVKFVQPEGGKVSRFQSKDNAWSAPLTIPGNLDFRGGGTYRLRLSEMPDQPGVTVWGRLLVEKQTDYTLDCAVPLEITREDIEDAKRNVLVVKVVFLPDEEHAVYAIPGAPTSIVSTRLEPGKDAVKEAEKQGTVLLVLRLGGRDYGM